MMSRVFEAEMRMKSGWLSKRGYHLNVVYIRLCCQSFHSHTDDERQTPRILSACPQPLKSLPTAKPAEEGREAKVGNTITCSR
eukprot:6471185-Pyramimonas_sp.AAC.1